jgi:hypothetical protein
MLLSKFYLLITASPLDSTCVTIPQSYQKQRRWHNYHQKGVYRGAEAAVPRINKKREHANFTPTWTNSVSVCHRLCCFSPFLICSATCVQRTASRDVGGRIFFCSASAPDKIYALSRRRNRTLHESNLVLCEGKINYTRCSPGAALCLCVDEWRAQRERKRDALLFFSRRQRANNSLDILSSGSTRVFPWCKSGKCGAPFALGAHIKANHLLGQV